MTKSAVRNSALQELIAEQKLLCEEFGSNYIELKGDDLIAVAMNTLEQEPLVGLRHRVNSAAEPSWYIYAGELQSDAQFEIVTVKQLQDILPEVLPYLALDVGYRFMIDQDDYEDVWKEGDQ